MKIGVLIKQVPDTETKIRIGPDATDIVREGIKYVMNPYDEYAVEQALQVKSQVGGDSSVTVVSLGPARVVETLRTALAMGADRAVHVKDDAFEAQDSMSTARALAAALRSESFDLVFAGKMAIDDNASTVPIAVADMLDVACVNTIHSFELSGDHNQVTVRRRIDGGEEVVQCALPALLSCEKGLNEPRYASLTGIMKAKKKPVDEKSAADLGLGAEEIGSGGSGVQLTRLLPLPERGECKFVEGEPQEAARALVQLLRNEAKVI
ncbi:MAG: electron transfer flavoprotein subunit beta/FixA family protein [Candidatus Latescibacterota bacterium]|nr:MAG: electron transfer flavoprotein subunit beta/FixA family protein [Candidatus Latescibacterota bacterium]